MSRFEEIMGELKGLGYVDEEGRVALSKKSNGEAAEESGEEIGDEDPEVEVSDKDRADFSQLLGIAAKLSEEISEKMAEFSTVLGELKVLIESAEEPEEETAQDQGEEDGPVSESE